MALKTREVELDQRHSWPLSLKIQSTLSDSGHKKTTRKICLVRPCPQKISKLKLSTRPFPGNQGVQLGNSNCKVEKLQMQTKISKVSTESVLVKSQNNQVPSSSIFLMLQLVRNHVTVRCSFVLYTIGNHCLHSCCNCVLLYCSSLWEEHAWSYACDATYN